MFDNFTLPFTIICLSLVSLAESKANLTVFLPFEGNAQDVSGNGNDGMVSGATLTSMGFEGSAFSFDGNDDVIEVIFDINPTAIPELTVGAWVNADRLNQQAIITNDDGGFDRGLSIDARGAGSGFRYSTFLGTGVESAGPDPALLDQFVFVAARYDQPNGSVTFDVDGDRQTFSTSFGAGFSFFQIGQNPGGSNENFSGVIDNVFLFDELLSDQRIDEIRAGGADAILGVPEPSSGIIYATCVLFFLVRRRRQE